MKRTRSDRSGYFVSANFLFQQVTDFKELKWTWRREWDSKNAAELFPSKLEELIPKRPHHNRFPVVRKLSFSIVEDKTKTRFSVHGGTRACAKEYQIIDQRQHLASYQADNWQPQLRQHPQNQTLSFLPRPALGRPARHPSSSPATPNTASADGHCEPRSLKPSSAPRAPNDQLRPFSSRTTRNFNIANKRRK
jgi:hypothetical protein